MAADVETSRAKLGAEPNHAWQWPDERDVIADLLLDPGGHPIIGHRGASGLAPENTLAAFDLARSVGADAFEFDIRLTADGIPVVVHDATLDRTTDGTGPVAALTWSELQRFDAGARFTRDGISFPFRGQGIQIPTLAEVLARYPEIPMLVELKLVAAGQPVREVLLAAKAPDRVVIASFQPAAVDPFREPPFLPGASRREIADLAIRSWLGFPPVDRGVRLYPVPDRYRGWIPVPTRRFVRNAKALGRPVHVWTVNDVPTAEGLWSIGCAGMITNFPGLLREARDRLKARHRSADT